MHNQTIEHSLYNIKNFTTPLELIIEQLHSRAIPSAGSGIVRQTLQFGEHGKWSHQKLYQTRLSYNPGANFYSLTIQIKLTHKDCCNLLFVAIQPEFISPNTNKWTELKHALFNSFANQRQQYCTISDVLGNLHKRNSFGRKTCL